VGRRERGGLALRAELPAVGSNFSNMKIGQLRLQSWRVVLLLVLLPNEYAAWAQSGIRLSDRGEMGQRIHGEDDGKDHP
jgi:hypothetical protein